MADKEQTINHITKKMAHHSLHSGYDQLSKHIECRIIEPNFIHHALDYCPGRILAQFRRSAGNYYGDNAFKRELQNIPNLLFRTNRIYHFLYGDDHFHYSGYLNPRKTNKIIATFHYPPKRFRQLIPITNYLKTLDAAIIVAPNQSALFESIIGSEKVHLIPHGVDTNFFKPYKVESSKKTCLFVGTHLRDFEMLQNVIKEINNRDSSIHFDIVTFKKNCGGLEKLKNIAFHFSITEEKLITLYNKADLLLMPVIDSTANNSLLEALSCGLPVVSTINAGFSYYLNDKCSASVKSEDVLKMADTALEIINNDRLKDSMSVEARKRALAFDWSIIAEQSVQLYNKLLPDDTKF
jgi:glycosyltransferase involved in cell wall biosynthesis